MTITLIINHRLTTHPTEKAARATIRRNGQDVRSFIRQGDIWASDYISFRDYFADKAIEGCERIFAQVSVGQVALVSLDWAKELIESGALTSELVHVLRSMPDNYATPNYQWETRRIDELINVYICKNASKLVLSNMPV